MKAILAVALPLIASLSAACGGAATTTTTSPLASTAARSSSSAAPTASPIPDPTASTVLSAFEATVLAFDQAVRAMNPDDPRIPATTTGNQVIYELTTLHKWKLEGITAKGDLPRVLHSQVVSSSADEVHIVACVYDPGVLIYASNGQTVPTNFAGQFYIDTRATLKLVSGTWKVADATTQTEASACLPGF